MSQARKLILLGAGGHGRVVLDIAIVLQQFNEITVYDDLFTAKKILGQSVMGTSIELVQQYQLHKNLLPEFIISIGNNAIRANKYDYLSANGFLPIPLLVHPKATIAASAVVDIGTVVMAGAIINPEARIGQNVIINTGAVIEHDCVIANHVHIAPHATLCGTAKIGEYTWIGAGATVIEGVSVGKHCVIGAGAVVTKDVPSYTLAVGAPAKVIKQLDEVV